MLNSSILYESNYYMLTCTLQKCTNCFVCIMMPCMIPAAPDRHCSIHHFHHSACLLPFSPLSLPAGGFITGVHSSATAAAAPEASISANAATPTASGHDAVFLLTYNTYHLKAAAKQCNKARLRLPESNWAASKLAQEWQSGKDQVHRTQSRLQYWQ